MKISEVTKTLQLCGWMTSRDEVGDRIAQYELSDRTVKIIYGLTKLPAEQLLWVMKSTTTDDFVRACSTIAPNSGSLYPLVRPWNDPNVRAAEILEQHIHQATDEAIEWAKNQNLDKALQEYAGLPTNATGAKPLWHLAALALLGEVEKLRSYQASFEAGNRLGFVPYVTKDYIDRAVVLAKEVTSKATSLKLGGHYRI